MKTHNYYDIFFAVTSIHSKKQKTHKKQRFESSILKSAVTAIPHQLIKEAPNPRQRK